MSGCECPFEGILSNSDEACPEPGLHTGFDRNDNDDEGVVKINNSSRTSFATIQNVSNISFNLSRPSKPTACLHQSGGI
ncbi:hypothetical protein BDV93DRAFT_524507 [Ceratobasidium sp. AG-I]|nr:hypothetical protein BDV93DRAFT_524507 [Ceratobasidium sp. AG-I]